MFKVWNTLIFIKAVFVVGPVLAWHIIRQTHALQARGVRLYWSDIRLCDIDRELDEQ